MRSGTTNHAPASNVSRGGLAALVASTLVALLVISVGRSSSGGGEIAAEEIPVSAESTSQTSSSIADDESSASSLLDDVDGAGLFEAGARSDMPAAAATAIDPVETGDDAAAAGAPSADANSGARVMPDAGEVAAPADLPGTPTTIAAASATAGAQVAPSPSIVEVPASEAPTTAAPTTAAPTTAAPTTTAAPAPTEPPTTAAPTTAAPVTEPSPPPTPSTSIPTENLAPTSEQWASLRNCESGGRYDVVSPNGLYHGAYQFAQSTWNGVARSAGRDDLAGVAPSTVDPADQDAMALVLWTQRGNQPWPVCGQYLPSKP